MSLVCVGSIAYDCIEARGAPPIQVLGGSATYFSVAASFFSCPTIVGVVGDDFLEEDIAFLQHRGIDCTHIERRKGNTFRWHGRYHDDMIGRDSLSLELGVFREFAPIIPKDLRAPDMLFLGNIEPRLQGLVLAQARDAGFVALDTIECWLKPPHRGDLLRLLPKVDILFVNDEEVSLLAEEKNVVRAAKKVLSMGAKSVVVKRGEHGAMFFSSDAIRLFPAFPLEAVVDPTGAGDSFAGGLFGYLSICKHKGIESISDALAVGTVVASFCVEGFGPRHLDKVRVTAIVERLMVYSDMLGFRLGEVLDAIRGVQCLEGSRT
jgi:sugar/nucleoside kinase (ribokinase family)